ncbi:MAG: rhomboid family intramembrane serine protease [Melioribacteraceae bacterium]|nr:rhomboid family intramembrane serine protease [Melioribacteraceae bacterium]
MKNDLLKIKKSIKVASCYISIIWLIQFFEIITSISFSQFGVYPRTTFGLIGILSSPLIHSDLNHLISNTFPLLFLLPAIIYFYDENSKTILAINYLVPNLLVWCFGRESFHIGSSGFLYALAFFIFFSGVFRKDIKSVSLSLIVAFLYGGLIWGVLPTNPRISFESHLFGAIVGIVLAFILKNNSKTKKYSWEDEEVEYGGDLEVSYKKGYPHS